MNSRNQNLSDVVPDDNDPVHALLALRSQGKGTSALEASNHAKSPMPMKGASQRDRREEHHQNDVVVDNFCYRRRHEGNFGLYDVASQTTRDAQRDDQQRRNQCVTYIGIPMPLPPRLPNPGLHDNPKLHPYPPSSRNDSR